jgi:hypothetical protein
LSKKVLTFIHVIFLAKPNYTKAGNPLLEIPLFFKKILIGQ